MSIVNNHVCCNCRHCIREWTEGTCHCKCGMTGDYLGYVTVMEHWCKHWSRERKWDNE